MENLLFIDVEATGVGPEDRLIQVAYRINGRDVNEMFKPDVPVKLSAMAVHHVTEKMLVGRTAFIDSPTYYDLSRLIVDGAVFVAHNAKYDLGMFAKESITFPAFICTLKLARYIDQGGRFENHQLQYLRYFYGLEIEAVAHDAFGDILVLEQVFQKLYEEFVALEYPLQLPDNLTVLKRLIEISSLPSMVRGPLNFGKFAGKTLEEVKRIDRSYLEWLLKSKLEKPEGEEDWIFSIKAVLKG